MRALLKRPRFLILDGLAGGTDPGDAALRDVILAELPESCLIFAAADGYAGTADIQVTIGNDGTARAERPKRETDAMQQEQWRTSQ